MDFELFDDESRRMLEGAGVQLPSSPADTESGHTNEESEEPDFLPPGGEPADLDSLSAAFGHWAELPDRAASASNEGAGEAEASGSGGKTGSVAHPPIDIRAMTAEEIRAFYQEQMLEDWDNAETYNDYMNQDIQDRLAYEATGVHNTWQKRKLQAPLILGALGLAEAFPMTAWFLSMSQAANENEAAFAAMFYPFRGGGARPGGQGATTETAASGAFRRSENVGELASLEVPMQLRSVKRIAREAGVGLKGVKIKIVRDPELIGRGLYGHTSPNGTITLYPDAFKNTETLVKTLGHERTHVMQFKLHGPPKSFAEGALNEKAAYDIEGTFWKFFRKEYLQ